MLYVLLIVWATGSSNGGIATLHAEFTTFETCEVARKYMTNYTTKSPFDATAVIAQGCFKK